MATSLTTSNKRGPLPKMKDYLHKNTLSDDSNHSNHQRKHSTPDSYDSMATDDYDDQSMKGIVSCISDHRI